MIELTPAMILVSKAARFAQEAHKDQQYGNHPYRFHLKQVADFARQRNEGTDVCTTLEIVSWLHDTLEDTKVTYKQIHDEFGLCVASCVQDLTKKEGQSYEDYMNLCLKSALVREVKICDTMSNLTNSIASNREKGIIKYSRQLHILVKGEYYE